jgi:tol-pal system protein YbgF
MKTFVYLAALLLALVLLPGCAAWHDYQAMRGQVTELTRGQLLLQARLDSLLAAQVRLAADERRRGTVQDSLQERQLDLLYELRAEMRGMNNYMDDRFNALAQRREDERGRYKRPAAPAEDTASAGLAVDSTVDPKYLYDVAYMDMVKGNYDLAVAGFQEFAARFPQNALADNALYWIAETHYVRKDFRAAVTLFEQVAVGYPLGNKVPAALYKAGLCYQQLGEQELATENWHRLIDTFPQSPEAALAKERLEPAGK